MILLDGKHTADLWVASFSEEIQKYTPSLAVILIGNHQASLAYVRRKKKMCETFGIVYHQIEYPETVSQEELLAKIEELNEDANISGIIVQLPVPDHITPALVFRAIDPKKDVDGFGAYNIGKMFLSPEFEHLPPATPKGIVKLLEAYDIDVQGKEVVVVGHSNIVGKPISTMLLNRNATVTTCHIHTKDLSFHTKRADILIVAAGKENLITAEMVSDGVVVVDVGINRKEDGKLVGDVDFENVSKKASYITPVPGGVGPMTVAGLLVNTIMAAKRQDEE